MPSREEFMRQMGLSANDLQTPPEPKPSTRRRPVDDEDEPRYQPTKAASPVHSTPPSAKPAPSAAQRAEFLRSLGIDNVSAPAEYEAKAPTTSSAAKPVPASRSTTTTTTTTTGGQSQQSRAEFLRSLGIENADGPVESEAAAGNSRNATGSQEYPRSSFRQSNVNTSATRTAKVSQIIRESEEESSFSPRPSNSPMKPASDITLGPKPTIQRPPATPGLDSELKGLSDGAGAEEVKNMGNKFFQAGDYRKAVRLYTRAIELDPSNAALYSNRSAAYLLGGKQMGIDTRSMALRDADKCVKLKPAWFKGYSRRGDALFKLERYPEAAEAYEAALEIDPGNTSIVHSLNELRPYTQKKANTEASSWSAPGSAILNSSVASGSMPKANKSAHEMLDEFTRERERTTPQLGRGGSDYKSAELERYRVRRTGDSSASGTFEDDFKYKSPMGTQDDAATPASFGGSSSRDVPSEFSSDAARDYQAQLLENYRKKKAQQQSGVRR